MVGNIMTILIDSIYNILSSLTMLSKTSNTHENISRLLKSIYKSQLRDIMDNTYKDKYEWDEVEFLSQVYAKLKTSDRISIVINYLEMRRSIYEQTSVISDSAKESMVRDIPSDPIILAACALNIYGEHVISRQHIK